jgi:transposase
LQGKINPELLHELSDCYDIYLFLPEKIKNNSHKINRILQEQAQEIVLPKDIKLVKKHEVEKNKYNQMFKPIVIKYLV